MATVRYGTKHGLRIRWCWSSSDRSQLGSGARFPGQRSVQSGRGLHVDAHQIAVVLTELDLRRPVRTAPGRGSRRRRRRPWRSARPRCGGWRTPGRRPSWGQRSAAGQSPWSPSGRRRSLREPWLRSDACFGTRAIVDLAALSGFEAQTLRLATRDRRAVGEGGLWQHACSSAARCARHCSGCPPGPDVPAETLLRSVAQPLQPPHDRPRPRGPMRPPPAVRTPLHALPVRRPGRTAPGLLCIRQRPAEHLIRRTAGLA